MSKMIIRSQSFTSKQDEELKKLGKNRQQFVRVAIDEKLEKQLKAIDNERS